MLSGTVIRQKKYSRKGNLVSIRTFLDFDLHYTLVKSSISVNCQKWCYDLFMWTMVGPFSVFLDSPMSILMFNSYNNLPLSPLTQSHFISFLYLSQKLFQLLTLNTVSQSSLIHHSLPDIPFALFLFTFMCSFSCNPWQPLFCAFSLLSELLLKIYISLPPCSVKHF